jgi:plasmid stability protein
MANLLVRNVDEKVVQQLRERAAAHGRSVEAEHRIILATVLGKKTRHKSFAEVLAGMPDVGKDTDFERVENSGNPARVFD